MKLSSKKIIASILIQTLLSLGPFSGSAQAAEPSRSYLKQFSLEYLNPDDIQMLSTNLLLIQAAMDFQITEGTLPPWADRAFEHVSVIPEGIQFRPHGSRKLLLTTTTPRPLLGDGISIALPSSKNGAYVYAVASDTGDGLQSYVFRRNARIIPFLNTKLTRDVSAILSNEILPQLINFNRIHILDDDPKSFVYTANLTLNGETKDVVLLFPNPTDKNSHNLFYTTFRRGAFLDHIAQNSPEMLTFMPNLLELGRFPANLDTSSFPNNFKFEADQPYIILERIQGETLEAWVDRKRRQELHQRLVDVYGEEYEGRIKKDAFFYTAGNPEDWYDRFYYSMKGWNPSRTKDLEIALAKKLWLFAKTFQRLHANSIHHGDIGPGELHLLPNEGTKITDWETGETEDFYNLPAHFKDWTKFHKKTIRLTDSSWWSHHIERSVRDRLSFIIMANIQIRLLLGPSSESDLLELFSDFFDILRSPIWEAPEQSQAISWESIIGALEGYFHFEGISVNEPPQLELKPKMIPTTSLAAPVLLSERKKAALPPTLPAIMLGQTMSQTATPLLAATGDGIKTAGDGFIQPFVVPKPIVDAGSLALSETSPDRRILGLAHSSDVLSIMSKIYVDGFFRIVLLGKNEGETRWLKDRQGVQIAFGEWGEGGIADPDKIGRILERLGTPFGLNAFLQTPSIPRALDDTSVTVIHQRILIKDIKRFINRQPATRLSPDQKRLLEQVLLDLQA